MIYSVEHEALVVAFGLLVEVLNDIFGDELDAPRVFEGVVGVDAPHLPVLNVFLFLHGRDILHAEGQHVAVADSVHNGIAMQLVAEGLCRCLELGVAARTGVLRENRRAGEAKDIIPLKLPRDERVHVAELRAVALVEDENDLFLCDGSHLILIDFVFQHRRQLLYRRDDELFLRVAAGQLPAQDIGAAVAVGRTFLEPVILLHRLVVQVFAVDDKHHLVDEVELRGQPCRR